MIDIVPVLRSNKLPKEHTCGWTIPTLRNIGTNQSSSEWRARRYGDVNSETVLQAAHESCAKSKINIRRVKLDLLRTQAQLDEGAFVR